MKTKLHLGTIGIALALAAGTAVDALAQGPGEREAQLVPAPNRRAGEGLGPFKTLVIRGAILIDGTGAPPQGPVDIVVEENRIKSVRGAGTPGLPLKPNRPPEKADHEIDGTGMYVLPGFVDLHVHAGGPPKNPEAEYPYKLWLAHGVTTVRGVSLTSNETTVKEKERSARNEIAAPRIFNYQRPGSGWGRGSVDTPEVAREWVQWAAANGIDGMKLGSSRPEIMAALLSKRAGEGNDWIEDAVAEVMPRLEGAFSTVVMTKHAVVAFRDPHGVRPLALGKVKGGAEGGECYVVASESCAFDIIGAQLIREVQPGEMVSLTEGGLEMKQVTKAERPAHCVFEHIYFSRPDTRLEGRVLQEVESGPGAFFVSIDVSVAKPAEMIAAGRATYDGLGLEEVTRAIRHVCASKEIVGFEITDVAPMLDVSRLSVMHANALLNACLVGMAVRKEGLDPDYVHPLALDHGQR